MVLSRFPAKDIHAAHVLRFVIMTDFTPVIPLCCVALQALKQEDAPGGLD